MAKANEVGLKAAPPDPPDPAAAEIALILESWAMLL